MTRNDCHFERVSHMGVGISLLFIAMSFSLISGTILPVLGLFAAIPIYFTAAYFFSAPPSQACEIR